MKLCTGVRIACLVVHLSYGVHSAAGQGFELRRVSL
jgi:hypothetical protein